MKSVFTRFLHEDHGQDVIEFALLGAFVSLAVYGGATLLGINLNTWYADVGQEMGQTSTKVKAMIP